MNNEIRFSIKQGNIEAAARFIVANNTYMHNKTVDYFIESIKETIKCLVEKISNGEEISSISTAGYFVTASEYTEDNITLQVLVNPSVSSIGKYVDVENII